jgi:hypothetical protein
MITDFVWPQLDDLDLDRLWFEQDGATCYTSRQIIIDLLRRLLYRTNKQNTQVSSTIIELWNVHNITEPLNKKYSVISTRIKNIAESYRRRDTMDYFLGIAHNFEF